MPYITTTKAEDTNFPVWEKGVGGVMKIKKSIIVKGGANVIDHKRLYTPKGIITKVSEEDVELLLKNPSFKRQMERGFYAIHKDNALHIDGLEKKDGSAQYKAEDFTKMGQKAPTSSKDEEITEEESLEAEEAYEEEEKARKRGRPAKK